MDPVSALGVASSAVQFFTFINNGLSSLSQIRKSANGFTNVNSRALQRVKSFLKDFEAQSNDLKEHKALNTSQTVIGNILASCIEAAEELKADLEKLRPTSNSALGTLVATINSIWKERRLSELSRRFNELRGDLMNEMVVVIL